MKCSILKIFALLTFKRQKQHVKKCVLEMTFSFFCGPHRKCSRISYYMLLSLLYFGTGGLTFFTRVGAAMSSTEVLKKWKN